MDESTRDQRKWDRTASERLEDINIILNQCDTGFCHGTPPVTANVLSNLLNDDGSDSSSEECAAWFTGVDNALRARVNVSFTTACSLQSIL